MKTLLLLRHAKSSWDDPLQSDYDRPLNARGRKAAIRMGQFLRESDFSPEIVLCSSSTRTRETADLVFGPDLSRVNIIVRDDLYPASPDQIAEVLHDVSEPASCVMLIGHNPGFEELLARMTGESTDFPTAALAQIEVKLNAWSQFSSET